VPHRAPEKRKEIIRKWRAANREKIRETSQKWRAANPDKVRQSTRAYREANREKVRAQQRNMTPRSGRGPKNAVIPRHRDEPRRREAVLNVLAIPMAEQPQWVEAVLKWRAPPPYRFATALRQRPLYLTSTPAT
jgi:hypothetical protein